MLVFPISKLFNKISLSLGFVDPVNNSTDKFSFLARPKTLLKCCSANTSVGAMKAT